MTKRHSTISSWRRRLAATLAVACVTFPAVGADAFSAVPRIEDVRGGTMRPRRHRDRFGKGAKPDDVFCHETSSALSIRGGGGSALRSIASPHIFVKTWAGMDVINGALIATAPTVGAKLYGVEAEHGTFACYLLQAIGYVMLGHGISLYLATATAMTVQRSIGFGLLVRLLFLFKSFLFGAYDKIEAEKGFMVVNTAIMSWCTLSLLTGVGKPLLAARTFSTAATIKASALFFRPVAGAKKFFGIDVGADDMAKPRAICKSLGFNLLISAMFMNTLAFGVDPMKAAGISALTWFFLLFEMTFVSRNHLLLEKSAAQPTVFLLFSSLLAYMLLRM